MMKRMLSTFLVLPLLGAFVISTDANADPVGVTSRDRTTATIVATYSGFEVISAREIAEEDHSYALAQLARARAEVKRLISEIKIEGAETVEIGGEVRAARMAEASWQRAADTVAHYLARLDSTVAER